MRELITLIIGLVVGSGVTILVQKVRAKPRGKRGSAVSWALCGSFGAGGFVLGYFAAVSPASANPALPTGVYIWGSMVCFAIAGIWGTIAAKLEAEEKEASGT